MTEHARRNEDEPMISETVLDDSAMGQFFAELNALADRPAPPANDELAALFAGATPLSAARGRRSRVARTGLIGLVTAGILTGGVTAAAADNRLPPPAQRVVARVVNTLTPLDIPDPDEQGQVEHQKDTDLDDNRDQPEQDVDQPGSDVDGPDEGGRGDGSADGEQGDRDSGERGDGDSQIDEPDNPSGDSQSGQQDEPGEDRDQPNANGSSGQTGSDTSDSDSDNGDGQQGNGGGSN